MKLKVLLVASVSAVVLAIYVPVFSDLFAETEGTKLEIFAPPIVSNNQKFIAALDVSGCTNKAPLVAWAAPGCNIEGNGSTITLQCMGSVGSSIKITAATGGGKPPACNGTGFAAVVIGGEDDAQSIPQCGNNQTVPITFGRTQTKVGSIRYQVTECIEAPPIACGAISNPPTSQDIKQRANLAMASAPVEIRWIASAVQSLQSPDITFSSFASYIQCISPATHPSSPEKVTASDLRAWMKSTIFNDSRLRTISPVIDNISDSSLIYLYRRAVEARRGLKFGSLK